MCGTFCAELSLHECGTFWVTAETFPHTYNVRNYVRHFLYFGAELFSMHVMCRTFFLQNVAELFGHLTALGLPKIAQILNLE